MENQEKIKEILEIIKMKNDQGDYVSISEAQYIERLINDVWHKARRTLTEYGQDELDKRLTN